MSADMHSCSYSCQRPACVLAQRDELAKCAEQDAAEIVRLRGEVALAAGWHDEAIAPAEAKGDAPYRCDFCGKDYGAVACCKRRADYIAIHDAPQPAGGEAVAWLRQINVALREVPIDGQDEKWFAAQDALAGLRSLLTTPPAAQAQAAPQEGEDEPEDVREIIARDKRVWALAGLAEKCGAVKDEGESGLFWTLALGDFYKLEAALQHRGDSRGGEG